MKKYSVLRIGENNEFQEVGKIFLLSNNTCLLEFDSKSEQERFYSVSTPKKIYTPSDGEEYIEALIGKYEFSSIVAIRQDTQTKGGPGSGSWESPGHPRFQWTATPEDIRTGHERFRQGTKVGAQAKKQEEKPKKDRSKIERFKGEDPRGTITKEGKFHVI